MSFILSIAFAFSGTASLALWLEGSASHTLAAEFTNLYNGMCSCYPYSEVLFVLLLTSIQMLFFVILLMHTIVATALTNVSNKYVTYLINRMYDGSEI